MEIAIKFSQDELHLLWLALGIATIHAPEEEEHTKNKERQMLQDKIALVGQINKINQIQHAKTT